LLEIQTELGKSRAQVQVWLKAYRDTHGGPHRQYKWRSKLTRTAVEKPARPKESYSDCIERDIALVDMMPAYGLPKDPKTPDMLRVDIETGRVRLDRREEALPPMMSCGWKPVERSVHNG
jgi:hypothetical protein